MRQMAGEVDVSRRERDWPGCRCHEQGNGERLGIGDCEGNNTGDEEGRGK